LGLDRADDRAIAETGASLGVPIARRVTVSASWALSAMRDSGVRQRASLTSGVSLPQNLALELDGSWSEEAAGSDSWSAHLGVTRAFGRRTTATVRAESDDALQSGYAEVNHSRPAGEGAGFRLGGRAGDTYEAFGDLDAEGRIGRFLADYHWSPELDGGSFGVAGGLTWIGGRVFASRPIDGSYALVRVPGVAKVHAYLNNNDVGVTDRRGDLIVPGLVPYYGNRLSIDDADVPIDYQIGGTERVIAPPDRSGAIVRFDVTAAHIVRGGVAAPGGDTAYGELAVDVDGQPHTSPIGRDGTFELADLPEGSWVGEVRYASGVCSVGLTVPHGAEPIVDVGALRCDPSSQVAHR
jgi:outer membrane usher protein